VRSLDQGRQGAGDHSVSWDGRDGTGRQVPVGVYGLRLESDLAAGAISRKVVRIR